MKKKFFAAAVSLVLILGLAACGSGAAPLTPEELIDKNFVAGRDYAMNMTMVMDGEMSVGEDGVEDAGSMPVNLNMSMDVFKKDGLVHADGAMSLDMFGLEMKTDMEQYARTNDDGSVDIWTYDGQSAVWSRNVTDSVDKLDDNTLELSSEMFSDLKLDTSGDEHIVTGKLKAADMGGMGDMAADMTGEASDIVMDVTLKFSVKTGEFISGEFKSEYEGARMSIAAKTIEMQSVEIPAELEDMEISG